MRASSKIGFAVAALLLALGLTIVFWGRRTPPTPEALIAQSLNDAEEAAKRRDARGVMDVVSESFKAGPLTRKTLNLQLIRAFQSGRGVDYDVQVNRPTVLPSPGGREDERLVVSRFAVFYAATGDDIWSTEPVTIVMRREWQRKWLVLREPRWRVVSVANMPPFPGSDDGLL